MTPARGAPFLLGTALAQTRGRRGWPSPCCRLPQPPPRVGGVWRARGGALT